MKTANQQQNMTAGRKALGLSLLARMRASLQTAAMTTFNRITEAGSTGERATASIRAIDLCGSLVALKPLHQPSPVSFYRRDWTHVHNIRGGNP